MAAGSITYDGSFGEALADALRKQGHKIWEDNETGWMADDAEFVQSFIATFDPLTQPRLDLLAKLNVIYVQKIVEGRNYNGKNYQIDSASLQNINGAASMAMAAQMTGQAYSQSWIATDNSIVTFSAPEMIAFGANVGSYVSALVMNNRVLKDAVAAISSADAVTAFDLTAGWPSN